LAKIEFPKLRGNEKSRVLVAYGDLQPLTLPDTLDRVSLIVQPLAQQRGDLAIAIAAVLPGKRDNIGGETLSLLACIASLPLQSSLMAKNIPHSPP
jgi:hypothetical protein